MALDEADAAYVKRRSALVRRWPIAASAMLVGIAAVPTLTLMAALLPILFLSCFVLLVALVLFQYAAMANERRLLRIIRSLTGSSPGDSRGG